MDEPTFYRQVIRAYRHCFAEVLDIVNGSQSVVARDIMQILREGQWRLDKLWTAAPDSLKDPSTVREEKGIAPLEEWR